MESITRNQVILFLVLGCLAFIILALSFVRESRVQMGNRLGAAHPTPEPQFVLATIKSIPSHGDYRLPDPGILPTSPYYQVKMVRDRIILILTTDPTRRAALLLLYADKRIAAAHELLLSGNIDQAATVSVKGEAYLAEAIEMSPRIDAAARSAWFDTLKRATLKHEEIVEELRMVSTGSLSNQAVGLYQKLGLYRDRIVTLSGEPFGYLRPDDTSAKDDQPLPASPSAVPVRDPLEPYL